MYTKIIVLLIHKISTIFTPPPHLYKNLHFLADTRVLPPPLAEMSAKYVSFFGRLPYRGHTKFKFLAEISPHCVPLKKFKYFSPKRFKCSEVKRRKCFEEKAYIYL